MGRVGRLESYLGKGDLGQEVFQFLRTSGR